MLAVWQPENLQMALLSALCFGVLGIVLMLLGFKLFDWILPKINVERELAENHNIAVGHRHGGSPAGDRADPGHGDRLKALTSKEERAAPRGAALWGFILLPVSGAGLEQTVGWRWRWPKLTYWPAPAPGHGSSPPFPTRSRRREWRFGWR